MSAENRNTDTGGLAILNPAIHLTMVTLRAGALATGVIREDFLLTAIALMKVTSKERCAAGGHAHPGPLVCEDRQCLERRHQLRAMAACIRRFSRRVRQETDPGPRGGHCRRSDAARLWR